jgi:BirA family biotin operon repressor/biotin-[acetyl-CoA-carboxylase] ligase
MSQPRFSQKAISEILPRELIRWEVYYFPELESTQSFAGDLFRKEGRYGIFVATNYQSAGRGREGRKWLAPPGKDLLFSFVLMPRHDSSRLPLLTLTVALAVCDCLRSRLDLKPEVKWPNDVLVNGKKVCGILTELVKGKGGEQGVIVGVGLNVNRRCSSFPTVLRESATSLLMETGRRMSRLSVLGAMMKAFEDQYFLFQKGQFEEIIRRWKGYSSMLGRRVSLHAGKREVQGSVLDLEDGGALVVRLDNGKTESFLSCDCKFV